MNSTIGIDSLNRGYLFNFVLFIVLFLPNPNLISIGGGNLYTNLREIGCVFLPIIYLLYPYKGIYLFARSVRKAIGFFFIVVFLSELLKVAGYGSSLSSVIRSLRPCISLFSMLLILLQGIKIDPHNLKKALLWALLMSFLLTILLQMILGISLEGMGSDAELTSEKTITRFGNQNASFGLIGVAMIMNGELIKKYFSECKRLAYITFSLSVFILLISFNRTMIAGMLLILVYYILKGISFKRILMAITLSIGLFLVAYYLYSNSAGIKRQIDDRILVLFESSGSNEQFNIEGFRKNAVETEREYLYEQYIKLYPKYPFFGVPIEVGLAPNKRSGVVQNVTDISLVTIVLRYGTFAGVLFITLLSLVLFALNGRSHSIFQQKIKMVFKISLIVAFLCSFNIDLLARQNFILFYFIILLSLSLEICGVNFKLKRFASDEKSFIEK